MGISIKSLDGDNHNGYGRRRYALGRRQAVRHRFLVPTFPGSNPGAPATSPCDGEVAREASELEVRRLAAQFAAEETEHVAALDQWLARTQRP